MENTKLIERFEAEMAKIHRTGIEDLITYIRQSDFFTARRQRVSIFPAPAGSSSIASMFWTPFEAYWIGMRMNRFGSIAWPVMWLTVLRMRALL